MVYDKVHFHFRIQADTQKLVLIEVIKHVKWSLKDGLGIYPVSSSASFLDPIFKSNSVV